MPTGASVALHDAVPDNSATFVHNVTAPPDVVKFTVPSGGVPAEGEETVPDSACPPRLFTHCLHPITSAKLGNFLARSAQPQERPLPLSQSEKGSAAAARGVVVVASSGHQGLRPRPCPHRCAAFLGLKIHSASATDCRLAPTSAKAKEGPRNPP